MSGTANVGLVRLKQAVWDPKLAVPSAWFESLLPEKKKGSDETNNATTSIYTCPKASVGMVWSGGVSAPARGLHVGQFPWTSVVGEIQDAEMENVDLLGLNLPVQKVQCVEPVVKVWHNCSHEGVSALAAWRLCMRL